MRDRVLVLHDPEDTSADIAAMVVETGFPALKAEETGDPALTELCSRDPRCTAVDISSLAHFAELVRVFRELPESHRPYCIIISPVADIAQQEQYLAAGADDYLVCPLDERLLRARLRPANRFLQMQRSLRRQSYNDPLTGVLNRTAVVDWLERELTRARRLGHPVSVVMADVDLLKRVNDTHGHLVGDAVMTAVAQRIASQLRPYDAVGRYGGDEFLIVLSNCNGTHAAEVCQRIRNAVGASQIITPAISCRTTLSIGVAAADSNATASVQNLIQLSDKALYEAKRSGRDRVVVAT